MTGMLGVVGEARGTLSKLNFPNEALLMTAILKILLNVLVQTLLLLPAFIVFKVLPSAEILLFPLGLLALLLFGCAIGVLLIPISTLFTDVSRGIQIVLRFGFFLIPVIYPIPESGLGRLVNLWNPVSPLLVTTRAWTIGGESPQILLFSVITIASLLVLAVGVIIYKLAMPHLIERMSS